MLATAPTVGEVVTPEREIIAVHAKDTVSQVLRTLGENGIFSGEQFGQRVAGRGDGGSGRGRKKRNLVRPI
jgi:CBS domain-containing protein